MRCLLVAHIRNTNMKSRKVEGLFSVYYQCTSGVCNNTELQAIGRVIFSQDQRMNECFCGFLLPHMDMIQVDDRAIS